MDHLDATVHLGLPADPGSIAVVRAVVASVASRLALAYDAVDDLRIAAAEASALLLSSGSEGAGSALTSSRAMPTCTSRSGSRGLPPPRSSRGERGSHGRCWRA